MTKIVKESHQIAERGVLLFNNYCNQHKPFIIFREVTKHDFGVDGEVELTRVNENNKTEPTGEIIKVQIKSVGTSNSYIRNESDEGFTFYASSDDIDYWLKHHKYGLSVLLVIADLRGETPALYIRKISDVLMPKSTKKISSIPVQFSKASNSLSYGLHNFVSVFSNDFKSRINFAAEETLVTNVMLIKKHPKTLYLYQTKYKTKKEIYNEINSAEAPQFVLKGGVVYTFTPIRSWVEFCSKVLTSSSVETIHFNNIKDSTDLQNIFLELIYTYLRNDLYPKRLRFSKDYNRFFFRVSENEENLSVKSRTRKRDAENLKKVVTYHEYGKIEKICFYRHLAVELKIKFNRETLLMVITPKYFFTTDKKTPLEPKLITKYTNYLTAREFNNLYLNSLHFWKTHLFNGQKEWEIFIDEQCKLAFSDFEEIKVKFGIPLDTIKKGSKENATDLSKQSELFQ